MVIISNWIAACTEKFGLRPRFKGDIPGIDALIPEIEWSEWNIGSPVSSWIAAAKSHASGRSQALS